MPHEPGEICSTDAPGTLEVALENTRRGAEAICRGGGLFATTRLAAEIEALRRWAESCGKFCHFEELSRPPDAFGYEHEVWFPKTGSENPRVLKATYANSFGVMPDGSEATPSDYLERLRLQNLVFGDDIELEGVDEPSFALIRIITSQQAIQGRPAEIDEIEMFFSQHGFQRFVWRGKSAWFREVDRVICADTHGGNILVTHQSDMAAIDVPVMLAPADFKLPAV